MYLDSFFKTENNIILISPEQASKFAKEVADDFNPLHNSDHKRFCVPGDLLFAISLAKYGLSQKMQFNYTGMVGKNAQLIFPNKFENTFELIDSNNKACLNATESGDKTTDLSVIEAFTKAYVAFSGHCFPHVLVPSMREKGVMINPARPLVIYESMAFEFNSIDIKHPSLKPAGANLEVDGKRGKIIINFDLFDAENLVGKGHKTMLLSGLREFDEETIQSLIKQYESSKTDYKSI